jgi:membrane protein YqaA with SNARE-associated domain
MKIFQPWFDKAITWASHKRAVWLLALLSFCEAIFFPVAPELMLLPMCLAKPKRGFVYAGVSLAGSVCGMFIGYAIGYWAMDAVMPLLQKFGYGEVFQHIRDEVAAGGGARAFWLLVIAGFTPVPFKIFTIASGAVGMPLLPFFFGALIGRGKRVFLVALFIRLFGEKAEAFLRKYIEPIGWVALAVLVAAVAWLFLHVSKP